MNEQIAVGTREKWVDNVKVIACILVVLGHFFQSMTKVGIISDGNIYEWFITTIYYFHVPLFFICSGYLYQKYSRVNNFKSWRRNVLKKALAFGIPYVTFTTATWILKKIFSSSVNNQIGSLSDTLLYHPTAPYWYLYALFFIFFVTLTFTNAKMTVIGLAIAVIAKLLILTGGGTGIYAISTVLANEIWFMLGMSISVFNLKLKGKKKQGAIIGVLFMGLSVAVYMANIENLTVSFVLGLMACIAVILLVVDFEEKSGGFMTFLAKYTMPIFLMHTLFAAPLRAMLLKVGISNAVVHVILGLGISFAGPIVVAWIMKKTKWLEFFLYPNKVLKKMKIR